jgi:hypothetical protein
VKGTIRFYENGELVHEQSNLVTTLGNQHILRHFSGIEKGIAQSIAVGVGDTAAAVGDTELEFEIEQADVLLVSPDFTEETVIFKGRLSRGLEAIISEAGLWSVPEIGRSDLGRMLFRFEDTDGWDAGTYDNTNTKIGNNSLVLNPALSTTETAVIANDPDLGGVGLTLDFSTMGAAQPFKLAADVADANCESIEIMFRTDASNYYTLTIATPAVGYDIFDLVKGSAVATGTPDWANITQAAIAVTAEAGGASQVDFDGLRVERFDGSDVDAVLVTHAILSTPYVKTGDRATDVEYSLSVAVT